MLNVVIPVYHSLDTLPDCLDSLVCQTKKQFFTTIIADGDGEDYSSIVQEYKRRGLHINFIELKENVGPGVARQRGIDAIPMCDYVTFLDSDDLFMPRTVEILYTEAKKTGADMITSPFITEEDHGPGLVYKPEHNNTWLHGKIYKTSYLKKIELVFPDEYKNSEDAYFNLIAWNCTPNKGKIDENTYIWRNNSKSMTREGNQLDYFAKTSTTFIISQIAALQKIYSIINNVSSLLIQSCLTNVYRAMMVQSYYNLNEEDLYIDMLKSFLKEDYVVKYFNNKLAQEELARNIPNVIITQEDIFYFEIPFNKWLNKIREDA